MLQQGLEQRPVVFIKHREQPLAVATNWFLMLNQKELVSILLLIKEWLGFAFSASRLLCVCIEPYGLGDLTTESLGL